MTIPPRIKVEAMTPGTANRKAEYLCGERSKREIVVRVCCVCVRCDALELKKDVPLDRARRFVNQRRDEDVEQ